VYLKNGRLDFAGVCLGQVLHEPPRKCVHEISRFFESLLHSRLRTRELLETRIVPERIEHWVEPEQCGSERRNLSEKFSVYCFGAKELTIFKVSKEPQPARRGED
jgi:hypothetical protein